VNKAGHLGHFVRGTAREIGKVRGVDIEEWRRGSLAQDGSGVGGADGIESVTSSCLSEYSGDIDVNIGLDQDDALAPSFPEQCDSDEEVFIGLGSFGKFKNSSRTESSSWSTAAYSIF
jgi:hypothetical protein